MRWSDPGHRASFKRIKTHKTDISISSAFFVVSETNFPLQMRDKFSCFSENSVIFSQPSCSNPSIVSSSSSSSSSAPPSLIPSVQNAVTSVYRTRPSSSSRKPLFITLSWLRSLILGQSSLAIGFGHDPNPVLSSSSSFKLISSSSRLFRKNRGTKRIELDKSLVEVFWDFSDARFDRGPEPLDGFYLVVVVDSELGLFLGDMAEEAVEKKLRCHNQGAPKFSLVSRREHCSGNALYHTRCQFGEASVEHDVVIRVSGEAEDLNRESILSVYIDRKKVMRVKKLQWNFRGSQMIFLGGTGLMINMLWDVHDWFFNQASEKLGVFMFTTRSGLLNGRFWVEGEEEKVADKFETDHRADDFSLLIYATKNS